MSGSENIACARIAPAQQPTTCMSAYAPASRHGNAPRSAWTKETAGLKWAPLTGPNNAIKVARTATVAPVLAMSATAKFPAERLSAMIPEPITVAASSSEPRPSAARRRSTTLGSRRGGLLSDGAQFLAQRHLIDGCDWQLYEELDPGFEFLECFSEGEGLIGVSACGGGRICDSPVRRHRFTRPYGAHFARRVVAHREDEVDRRRPWRRELVPALTPKPLRRQIRPFEQIDRQRMDLTFREAPGTKGVEPAFT